MNSAGITRDSYLLKMSESDFDQVIAVNLKGTHLITQATCRLLVAEQQANNVDLTHVRSYASIINISSVIGKYGNMGQTNYAASKAGVIGFTLSTAKEMGRFKIRCNSILPGYIRTPMTDRVPQKSLDMVKRMIALERIGEPDDVAQLALFLASESSSYITGTNIECSGGLAF
jgi:17beta-estradiol 17-dehydrogenase/3alpha(17beta)-hydroxysteroid dehydrogenase (NAD+)